MRRDDDLIRNILLRIEEDDGKSSRINMSFDDCESETVMYHLGLLLGRGYITAIEAHSSDGEYYIPRGLTWEGHEFLDAARNENVWQTAKGQVKELAGTVPLEILKAMLMKIVMQKVGL